jgi:two-component system, OmpR family, alkaline phosphatase synthesis response regulator PhoP
MTGPRPPGRRPIPISTPAPRASWLVLATTGAATQLERLAGGSVTVVDDIRRFRELLLATHPRLVVCGQPPAGVAELELLLAERRRRSGLRIVHLAPPEAVDDRLAALTSGFDDALASTIPAIELVGRLTWLDGRARARATSGSLVKLGEDLELDLAAHELRHGGAAVHLRPKEFGLLALLATHPGRAYTRAELLERVWNGTHEGGGRTVDVHVRWLRSKIEPDPERPVHLVTVRGVGYRYDARRG